MAELHFKIRADYEEVIRLRDEIKKLETKLKSFGRSLPDQQIRQTEEQLKALTAKYDDMVRKIAKLEGEATLAMRKIEKATAKIAEAQKKATQPTTSPQAKDNINEQVLAYSDLKDQIDKVLNSQEENLKSIIKESNAIRLVKAEMDALNKKRGDNGTLTKAQQTRYEQLSKSLMAHKAALTEYRQRLNADMRIDKAVPTSMNAISASLGRMRSAYRALSEEQRNSHSVGTTRIHKASRQ